MVNLQELIIRARFIFSKAPKRLEVFDLINGKRSTKELARKTGRSLSSVLQDIQKIKDMELVKENEDKEGNIFKKEGAAVYEKMPMIKHVPFSYFQEVAETRKLVKRNAIPRNRKSTSTSIHTPSEQEILEICKHGEVQLYEFKAPGIESAKLTKEISAFLHTRNGGIVFYGIDDDGIIIGSDFKRQEFDQRIQNSVRNTLSPQPNIEIKEKNVMGSKIIMIVVPPWDRRTLYQYTKSEKYYIRKGTNIFALKPDEIKKLSRGQYIV